MITFLRNLGASYNLRGSEFCVWAPFRSNVELILDGSASNSHPMVKDPDGYWTITFPHEHPESPRPGSRYYFQLDGGRTCPDPASLSQPDGVHGASELLNPKEFKWTDQNWKGFSLADMIIYELHTGTFSPTHDFAGVLAKLDYLTELGINTIELMPLGQFAGKRNWGYDGVYPFAIQNSYGGVQNFQRLVDAAHRKGIAVVVDVIYNHLGPEGNYLDEFGPYFTDKYKTPWGKALNFDDAWSDGVRNFFLQNARMWLEDYHVDGLRLDAVHAIRDFSAVHIIQQLRELAADIEHRTGRIKQLIAEIDLNDPRYVNPVEKGGYGLDGQWNDEFHHALRALMTGDRTAYYEDFGEMEHLEKAFRQTYVYDGNYSNHRKRHFGSQATGNPYGQFIAFAQNHDQIGNRAFGDRLTANLNFEQLKLAAAALLLSPYIPLLFMGEEYGEENPFAFFVDFSDKELVETVRKGRRSEFQAFAGDHQLPDPQAQDTFEQSVLSGDNRSKKSTFLFEYYRRLIALRKKHPALRSSDRNSMIVHPAVGMTLPFERVNGDNHLFIWLHFGDTPVRFENNRGIELHKVWDSASLEWGGPGERSVGELPMGYPIDIAPHSVIAFEKKHP